MIFATKQGLVKKTALNAFRSVRSNGIISIALKEGDELISTKLTNGNDEVILVTKKGQSIRFSEMDVRPMGRNSRGVKGVTLGKGDEVLGSDIVRKDCDLLVLTENGYGKRTPLSQYSIQRRGGKGIKTIKAIKSRGDLIGAKVINAQHELLLVSAEGIVLRVPVSSISSMGRNTQGVRVMNLKGDDKVSSLARVVTAKKSKLKSIEEEQIKEQSRSEPELSKEKPKSKSTKKSPKSKPKAKSKPKPKQKKSKQKKK